MFQWILGALLTTVEWGKAKWDDFEAWAFPKSTFTRGWNSAERLIKRGDDREQLIAGARSDLKPDEFTRGFIARCETRTAGDIVKSYDESDYSNIRKQ